MRNFDVVSEFAPLLAVFCGSSFTATEYVAAPGRAARAARKSFAVRRTGGV